MEMRTLDDRRAGTVLAGYRVASFLGPRGDERRLPGPRISGSGGESR